MSAAVQPQAQPIPVSVDDDSSLVMTIEEDSGLLTSRTHDGVTGHTVAAKARPASPAHSAYTPSTAAPPQPPGEPQASRTSSAKREESKESPSSSQTQLVLAKTQTLPARQTATRPASSASAASRPRSSQPLSSTALVKTPSSSSKLPFYAQTLAPPPPSAVHPLSPQHMNALPLAAVLAHVSRANTEALELMKTKEYQLAFERLKRAEAFCHAPALKQDHTKSSVSLRASTYNNLAILHKSINQLRPALWYANRALRLEINFLPLLDANGFPRPRPNPAGTHLNMCAILSSLGRHSSALLHAECALSSLYLELHQLAALMGVRKKQLRAKQGHGEEAGENEEHQQEEDQQHQQSQPNYESDKQSILELIAVAYHNKAVEEEFLKQYRASTHSYRRALEFARKRLGEEHRITVTIAHAYEGAVNLHPLKVTAPDQSMDPHTKLKVHNTAATASAQANRNKWLIPSLENNPMTARHIPVRYVPFNQFISVTGMPGREMQKFATSGNGRPNSSRQAGGRGRFQKRHGGGEDEKESDSYGYAGDEGDVGFSSREVEDDFGPPVTEERLRQRLKHAVPNYPPPQHPMNPEEPVSSAGAVGNGAAGAAAATAFDEEAGYWSDPELTGAPAASGTGKARHDPRMGQVKAQGVGRAGGRGAGAARTGSIPQSASLGQLDATQFGAGRFAIPMQLQQHLQAQQQRLQQAQQQQQQQQQQSMYQAYQPYPPPPVYPQQYQQAYGYPPSPAAPYPYAAAPYQPAAYAPYGYAPSPPSTAPSFLPQLHPQQQQHGYAASRPGTSQYPTHGY